ncbi:Catabolite control protein A [Frondihabitans sp. 762G35]|uniref:LacI family DNA-binding transcriptional regulator n=1 Tax=Frondihabitans sp. 762G35 TaxID=1446794 RepID=UPI000D21A6C9|nr:LacI family DNA-binding transcriptional regulator [Frondihabitans sp. 762G35]ARC58199.1 Catabolite control protein A [Frondihabitans sp. 762G35]
MSNATSRPVISDVARAAGVSIPTVSRVLTGAAKVSEDKRERVLRAIDELKYRPSATARALVAGQPTMVAIIAGNTSRFGYAETIRGVEQAAREAGFLVSITVVETSDPETVDGAVGTVLSQPIAGIVVLKFDPCGVQVVHRLPPGVPAVSISGIQEVGPPQAVLDERAAARELVDHLLDLGHETVHHVRVPPSREEDGRTSGWRDALVARGRRVPGILDATWDPESGEPLGRALADSPDVTAVFCGNDEIAMGVVKGLVDGGKSVPGDVSVAGFDDHPLARLWNPPLTTVRQDFAGLGTRAFALLLTQINGESAPAFSSTVPRLVVRDSVDRPRRG